jgi:hypothetical protein
MAAGDSLMSARKGKGRRRNPGGSPVLSSGPARKALPTSSFAGPGRTYPIPDAAHARNALARASGKSVEGQVRAAVHRRYPQIGRK